METSKVQSPSVTAVLEKRARNFEKKIVHSGTKQNIYCKLKEIHTKLSVTNKNSCRKKSPPPLLKKYNGPSVTCLV